MDLGVALQCLVMRNKNMFKALQKCAKVFSNLKYSQKCRLFNQDGMRAPCLHGMTLDFFLLPSKHFSAALPLHRHFGKSNMKCTAHAYFCVTQLRLTSYLCCAVALAFCLW